MRSKCFYSICMFLSLTANKRERLPVVCSFRLPTSYHAVPVATRSGSGDTSNSGEAGVLTTYLTKAGQTRIYVHLTNTNWLVSALLNLNIKSRISVLPWNSLPMYCTQYLALALAADTEVVCTSHVSL